MAEDDIEDEIDDEDEGEDGEESAKKGGKSKAGIFIGIALLLVIGGAAGAYFTGLLDPVIDMLSSSGVEEEPLPADAVVLETDTTFYDLDEILVNLNTGDRKSSFLKIRVTLELNNPQDVPVIEEMKPRILDTFQVYLRELRIEDLKGSAGMYRLREELLTRVSVAASPAQINDVLFKEMIIQ